MKRWPEGLLGILALLFIASCASSMTPSQFNDKLPKKTSAKFYSQTAASEAQAKGDCKLLVAGRKYAAPMGLSVSADLNGGAKGIDEWVKADSGNAYSVSNFEWVAVGDMGGTQLVIHFDTMRCG